MSIRYLSTSDYDMESSTGTLRILYFQLKQMSAVYGLADREGTNVICLCTNMKGKLYAVVYLVVSSKSESMRHIKDSRMFVRLSVRCVAYFVRANAGSRSVHGVVGGSRLWGEGRHEAASNVMIQ